MSIERRNIQEAEYVSFEERVGEIEEEVVEAYAENERFEELVKTDRSPEEIVDSLEEEVRTEESGVKNAGKYLGYASNGAAVLFGAAYAATTGPVGLSVAATGLCSIEYMRRMSKMDNGTGPEREYLSARVSEDLEVETVSEEEGLYGLELEPEYDDSELLDSDFLDYPFL